MYCIHYYSTDGLLLMQHCGRCIGVAPGKKICLAYISRRGNATLPSPPATTDAIVLFLAWRSQSWIKFRKTMAKIPRTLPCARRGCTFKDDEASSLPQQSLEIHQDASYHPSSPQTQLLRSKGRSSTREESSIKMMMMESLGSATKSDALLFGLG